MSFISSFDIIAVVRRIDKDKGQPDPKILLCIYASAADAVVVNPKRIEKLSANGLITFFIKGNPVFSNGPKSLPRNHPDCAIL